MLMTVVSGRKVNAIHEKNTIEFGCKIMTVESKSKVYTLKEQNSAQVPNTDC